MNRVYAMASAADRDEIDAALELGGALAHEVGQPYLAWQVAQRRCPQVLLTGEVDEAERLAGEAFQIATDTGQPDAFALFGAHLAGIRWQQGRIDELLPLIAEAAADNPGLPGFQAAYALMLCECDRADEARPLLEVARQADFHHAAYDWTWLTTTCIWADAVAWLGDVPAAEVLYDRLAPYEAQGVTSGATFTGTVAMYLARLAAVLGRHDDALAHFERADHQLRALRAPFAQARNQVEWARLLSSTRTANDRRHARELLAEATATAATHGCAGIERRAVDLARLL
jgi:tetratricopeptide (TPR) repeat protein